LRPTGAVRVLKPGWEKVTPAPPSVAPVLEPVAPELATQPVERAAEAEAVESERVSEPLVERAAVLEPAELEADVVEAEPAPTGFASFVAALSELLAEQGATRAAANVGALLGMARLAPDAFDATTAATLVARGMLDATSGRPTPEFSVLARAWRDVLDDTGGDLSACGSATLDVFGATLLVTLLGVPTGRAEELRRALRQRGVAAFGMLVAA
jgi:hypothetical protein